MSPSRWNNALLDEMRLVGDEPADRAIRVLYEYSPDSTQWNTIHSRLDSLVENASQRPAGLPAELTEYLEATAHVPAPLLAHVSAGEAFFASQGPEILMLLACYSLPAAYSAAKGAHVLCRTEFLEKAARLRLFQTAQMIVDVMAPGGLGAGGKGIRAAQKVRLFHAAIRHLILADTDHPWNVSELGVPINQEDLAGTLMTFSCVILDGLAKLDIVVPEEQQRAYFDAWRAVGRLMGVKDTLVPDNVEEGRSLMNLIHQRQVAPSSDGVRLTAALLQAMSQGPIAPASPSVTSAVLQRLEAAAERIVHPLSGAVHHELGEMAVVLMRHLLHDEVDRHGTSVADLLQIPPAPDYAEHFLDVALKYGAEVDTDVNDSARRRRVLRWFNLHLIDWMLTKQLGAGRPLFSVPDTLHSSWKRTPIP